MNKGQPCILDNKDVDNGKEDVSMSHKQILTRKRACICSRNMLTHQHIHLRANSLFIAYSHTSICSVGYKFLLTFFRKSKVGCLGLLVMAG